MTEVARRKVVAEHPTLAFSSKEGQSLRSDHRMFVRMMKGLPKQNLEKLAEKPSPPLKESRISRAFASRRARLEEDQPARTRTTTKQPSRIPKITSDSLPITLFCA